MISYRYAVRAKMGHRQMEASPVCGDDDIRQALKDTMGLLYCMRLDAAYYM